MKLNTNWRGSVLQTLLPIFGRSGGCKPSDGHLRLCEVLTPALRFVGMVLFVALASFPCFAQVETDGFPEDWTHHHVVFSDPGTIENALVSGSYYSWRDIVTNLRFAHQRNKRNSGMKTLIDPDKFEDKGDYEWEHHDREDEETDLRQSWGNDSQRIGAPGLEKDWRRGILTGTVQPNTFPAKWSFGTTTASCANDYVVYPTGSAGTTAKASIVSFSNLYSGCGGIIPSVRWAYDTAGTVSTSPVLSLDGSQLAFIQVKGTAATLVLLKGNAGPVGRNVTGILSVSSPEITISVGTFTQADVGAQITGIGIPAGDTIAAVLSATTANLAIAPAAHASETLTIKAEAVVLASVRPRRTLAIGAVRPRA